MGECKGAEYVGVDVDEVAPLGVDNFKKVSVLPLVFLIFYEVSGGAFGIEDAVRAAGPLLALLGFLIFPFIWSIPEALITAEMGTMFPENGGYVVWVSSALGPYWGFQLGWMKWFSGVIDNALYPLLFLDYLSPTVPALTLQMVGDRKGCELEFVFEHSLLEPELLGLNQYYCRGGGKPKKDSSNGTAWTDGYFSYVAKMIGGVWLSWWIAGAAAASNLGMFVAEMSSDSFQLLGMAERGMLPSVFAKRSRYGTPLIGILLSASGVLLLSWMSFQETIAAENFLYCFGMILEFIAFVRLRIKYPAAPRPYKIPLGTIGSILMCIPPTILICIMVALSSLKVAVASLIVVIIGLLMQPCLKCAERKKWFKFSVSSDLPDLNGENDENVVPLMKVEVSILARGPARQKARLGQGNTTQHCSRLGQHDPKERVILGLKK
ncbi:unnamed protein product, partial [Vitis vinifera]